jgi:sensor histidine kinase YesM
MEILIKFLGVIALIILLAVVLAFPVKWLWNWLMPVLFELPRISVWQALGLTLLTNILFKGYNGTNKL